MSKSYSIKPVFIALSIVGALLGILIYYLIDQTLAPGPETEVVSDSIEIQQPEQHTAVEQTPQLEPIIVPPTPASQPEPEANPETHIVLPRLDDSDPIIRDGIIGLTRHEGIHAWLGGDALIRKIVIFVDNIANGNVAREPAAILAPISQFSVNRLTDKMFVMDATSYRRYDLVTSIFISMDAKRTVSLYILLKPLFQEAYAELGYPDVKFDDVIFRAIGLLLETPVLTQLPRLIRPIVTYQYEAERLESLSAAQKQLLRMGPNNTQAIQAKLSELAIKLRAAL